MEREGQRLNSDYAEFKRETKEFRIGECVLEVSVVETKGDERSSKLGNYLLVEKLAIRNEEGKNFSFQELLPRGWQVVLAQNILCESADQLNKRVVLFKTKPTEEKVTLSSNEELPEAEFSSENSIFGPITYQRTVHERLREVNVYRNVPALQLPSTLLTFLHEVGHVRHPNNQDLPEDYSERERYLLLNQETSEQEIAEERDAWSFALTTLRKLRDEGFNLGEDLTNNTKLKEKMEWPLTSYGARKKPQGSD